MTECCLCVHDGDTVHLWRAYSTSNNIKQQLLGVVCVEITKRKEVVIKWLLGLPLSIGKMSVPWEQGWDRTNSSFLNTVWLQSPRDRPKAMTRPGERLLPASARVSFILPTWRVHLWSHGSRSALWFNGLSIFRCCSPSFLYIYICCINWYGGLHVSKAPDTFFENWWVMIAEREKRTVFTPWIILCSGCVGSPPTPSNSGTNHLALIPSPTFAQDCLPHYTYPINKYVWGQFYKCRRVFTLLYFNDWAYLSLFNLKSYQWGHAFQKIALEQPLCF